MHFTQTFFILSTFAAMATAFDYVVGVGKDETTGKKGMGFDPSVIHPQPGDHIVFEFRSGDHSAIQSTFDLPCTPMEGGFSSGVIVVPDSTPVDASGLPTMRLTVNSTDPLWFFDQAGGLCHRGAVLAVNPSTTQTAAQFKENASKDPGPSSVASAKNNGGASATSGDGEAPLQTGTAFNSGRGTKDDSMAVVSFAAVFFGVVIGIL